MQPLLIEGMHGLGDNIHQRAILRQLMQRNEIWLESSWVSIYHDLIEQGLKVLYRSTRLRTQQKNANREADKFSKAAAAPSNLKRLRIAYSPQQVRARGSVLGAMCETAGCDIERADFRLPVPDAWKAKAQRWIDEWRPSKPLLIYRPLNERKEWSGNQTRNPRPDAYAHLFNLIRDRYFVVSVADIVPNEEWIVGGEPHADVKCHSGELDVETIVALVARASLVYTAPGFAVIMAQAVGTPLVAVFGGYEKANSFVPGARFNRSLFVEPVTPCDCFKHTCPCTKIIELVGASEKLERFVNELADRSSNSARHQANN